MSEWRNCRLSGIADVIDSMHQTPKYSAVGKPLVRVTDLKNGYLNLTDCLQVTEEVYEAYSSRHKSQKGDIVFARVGSYGNLGFVNKPMEFCLGQNTAFIIPKEDARYLYYYLKSPFGENEIEASVGGSTQPTVSIKSIKNFEVLIPPLYEQKAIALVLSSLDDKIDLLHRQNKTLEAMAETLFHQWFIEEAKEDWKEKTIGDIFTIRGGSTPSTKVPGYWNGGIAWTSPRDLSTAKSLYMFSTERTITEAGLAKVSSGLLPVGTLLMSSRAPIGYLAITDLELAVNQGYIAIIAHELYSNEFMYLWCKANMELIKNSGNGSVFQEISKASFRDIPFTCLPIPLLGEFEALVKDWFNKIKLNAKQIQTLEQLRDTLLPKLMSGEVRVQYQTEEVA